MLASTAPHLSRRASLAELIRRPQISYADSAPFDPARPKLPKAVTEQAEIRLKYDGYIKRQLKQVERVHRMESARCRRISTSTARSPVCASRHAKSLRRYAP